MIRQRDYLKAKAVKTLLKYLFEAFRQIRKILESAMNQPTKVNPVEKLVFK